MTDWNQSPQTDRPGANNPTRQTEIRRIRRVLRELGRMAHDAGLTGSLEKGARSAALQYNQVLRRLEELGALSGGLFTPLGEGVTFAEVGVSSASLAGYLEEEETPDSSSEPGEPSGEHCGFGSHNVILGLGGLRELKELKELGQVIRENLPEWLKERGTAKVVFGVGEKAATLSDVESRLAEVGAKLQAVAEQLRRGDLSDVQRAELAEQLSRLGQEQARLARRHATLRDACTIGI